MAGETGMRAPHELPEDAPSKVMPGAMRIGFPTWAEVTATLKRVAKANSRPERRLLKR